MTNYYEHSSPIMRTVRQIPATTLMIASISIATSILTAYADDALKMELQANKVVVQDDGRVSYIPVSTAKSGTVIQYKATYTNMINEPINNVKVTLPIPMNMTFNGEAHPPSAQASIDSINFFDMPLVRRVDNEIVPVPLSEYKALRWNIKLLPAKKTAEVSLNAIID